MFQCEHPDSEHSINDNVDEPLKLKIVQEYQKGADAPEIIQLNWSNTVLWRMALKYPK